MEPTEGTVGAAGEVQVVRLPANEYQERIDRILGTISLNEDELAETLLVEYRAADGTATVWVRAQAAGSVSVMYEIDPPVDLLAVLGAIHDAAYKDARARLKRATAEHLVAELASRGGGA